MNYLHYNKIIHSDIKPENILIGNDFNMKLCDFGFSKIMSQNCGRLIGGTEGFFAPESYYS